MEYVKVSRGSVRTAAGCPCALTAALRFLDRTQAYPAIPAMRATPPTVETTMAAMIPGDMLPLEPPSGGGMYPVARQVKLTACPRMTDSSVGHTYVMDGLPGELPQSPQTRKESTPSHRPHNQIIIRTLFEGTAMTASVDDWHVATAAASCLRVGPTRI